MMYATCTPTSRANKLFDVPALSLSLSLSLSRHKLLPFLTIGLVCLCLCIGTDTFGQVCGIDDMVEIEGRSICKDIDFYDKDDYIPNKLYNLNLYVYILRPDDGDGGPSKEDVLHVLNITKNHFMEHNILLEVACIKDTLDDLWFYSPGFLLIRLMRIFTQPQLMA